MRIGVVMGGTSAEKDVSLLTGNQMIDNLDRSKYEVVSIEINSKKELIEKSTKEKIDFALIALHGNFGENGEAQAILEGFSIPHSGSGVLSSSLCMNKDISKRLMKYEGINTPDWVCIEKHDEINYELLEHIGYPLVVKPVNGGSSIGTYIVKNAEEVVDAVLKAFDYDKEIMIEKYIHGREISCSILDGKVLPVALIKPSAEFFDYKSKYEDGGSEETIIYLEEDMQERIEDICSKCWKLFNCQVYGRIDIILKEKQIYVLEINTLPGMTRNSIFPKSANAINMSFTELLDNIIDLSLKTSR